MIGYQIDIGTWRHLNSSFKFITNFCYCFKPTISTTSSLFKTTIPLNTRVSTLSHNSISYISWSISTSWWQKTIINISVCILYIIRKVISRVIVISIRVTTNIKTKWPLWFTSILTLNDFIVCVIFNWLYLKTIAIKNITMNIFCLWCSTSISWDHPCRKLCIGIHHSITWTITTSNIVRNMTFTRIYLWILCTTIIFIPTSSTIIECMAIVIIFFTLSLSTKVCISCWCYWVKVS